MRLTVVHGNVWPEQLIPPCTHIHIPPIHIDIPQPFRLLYPQYISGESEYEVNIGFNVAQKIRDKIAKQQLENIFDEAQENIYVGSFTMQEYSLDFAYMCFSWWRPIHTPGL